MSKNRDIVFFKKILKYLVLLAIGASIFLFIASKFIILIFYSDKYLESIKISYLRRALYPLIVSFVRFRLVK